MKLHVYREKSVGGCGAGDHVKVGTQAQRVPTRGIRRRLRRLVKMAQQRNETVIAWATSRFGVCMGDARYDANFRAQGAHNCGSFTSEGKLVGKFDSIHG